MRRNRVTWSHSPAHYFVKVGGVWCQYHGVVLLPPDWSLWLCFLSCAAAKVRVIIAKQSIILILLLGTSCATLQFGSLAPVISFGFKRLKGFETLSNGCSQSFSDINSSSTLAKTIYLGNRHLSLAGCLSKAKARSISGTQLLSGGVSHDNIGLHCKPMLSCKTVNFTLQQRLTQDDNQRPRRVDVFED